MQADYCGRAFLELRCGCVCMHEFVANFRAAGGLAVGALALGGFAVGGFAVGGYARRGRRKEGRTDPDCKTRTH